MINKWLVKLGLWIAKQGGWCSDIPGPIMSAARRYVREQQNSWPDRDGETKRAAVYRTLVNIFPTASRRDIARAIEEAVCSDC